MLQPILAFSYLAIALGAQHQHSGEARPAIILKGMGAHRRAIATANAGAQQFFNQGLVMLYGFNREESVRSFHRAAELDPKSPMPWWGLAMATGPHINMDGDGDVDRKVSCEAAAKAGSLAGAAPAHERAWAEAVRSRCRGGAANPDEEYRDAMRALWQRYPDDLDAGALYAESLLVLRRWRWWNRDGTPADGVAEAVRVLEHVMRRNPDHPAANHYYIHAVEMSPSPERALPSAYRLMGIVPGAGHLVHMPGHIHMLMGDWEMAADVNLRAAEVDEEYIKQVGPAAGPYQMGYYPHNLDFVVYARMMQGRYDDALKAAEKIAGIVTPAIDVMPDMAEFALSKRLFVRVRFQRWDEILALPAPDKRLFMSAALRFWARGLAHAARGRRQEALREQKWFLQARRAVPEKWLWVNNQMHRILDVAGTVLEARLAERAEDSIALWRKAVDLQDALVYDEPPPWFHPIRESLGGALLRAGRAAEAERVFRADLEINRRNGRSLFGLIESIVARNRKTEADWVRREFNSAWSKAQVTLSADTL
ncbi:MAG: tetratricopeptide repeat protein [Bryobacteraceae bacterium]